MAFDLVIKGGSVYDGTGSPPVVTDVAVSGDRIVRIGGVDDAEMEAAVEIIDASGLAVAPGFVNMLSHAYASMIKDGRSLSDLMQGVTTQLFGEGFSMGPVLEENRSDLSALLDGEVPWRTLREYLLFMEKRGVSQNVASLVGATTLRILGAGRDDRPMDAAELDRVKGVLADEMSDGAMGLGSALIYPPGFYASTDELVELAKIAGRYGGMYFSHLRSEGARWEQAIDELLHISRAAELPAEVWHIKALGRMNWAKMDSVLDTLEAARAVGERISADMYPYTAGGTGLAACVPPRYASGGPAAMRARFDDPGLRAEIARAMATEEDGGWENLYLGSTAEGVFMVTAKPVDGNDAEAAAAAKAAEGRTLADYAASIGLDPVDAALDLIARVDVGCMYFMIDEANVSKIVGRPWISVGSDAASLSIGSEPNSTGAHPRTYGSFARFVGRYCRDGGLASLGDAIRRVSAQPAETLGLDHRGRLETGWYADVVVFDAEAYIDTATYEHPHSYATGMHSVVVNGTPTLRAGEHTGRFAGRALAGRGRR